MLIHQRKLLKKTTKTISKFVSVLANETVCVLLRAAVYVYFRRGDLAACERGHNECVCVCLIMGDITVMRYQDVWTLIAPHLCLTSPVIEECVGVGVMSVRFVTTELRLPVFPLVRSVM